MRFAVLIAFVPIFLGNTAIAAPSSCAAHLVTVTVDGTVSQGSKQSLREAVQAGLPVRVGWSIDVNDDGNPELRHWADALFLTEFGGEVFAQLADIQRQTPTRSTGAVKMPAGRQRWTGLIGTNGVLESHFDNGTEPQSVRMPSEWCVDARASSCLTPQWRLVYSHDADGKPLSGSKERLFNAVRRGQPIRFAWGMSVTRDGQRISVEHAAVPDFLSIANGTELTVQLPEHIAQASYHEPDKARFDNPAVMWRGLMATDGSFDAVLVDRATGKEVRRLPQRAGLTWFALAPEPACDPAPVELAVPGGVRRE